MCPCSKNVLFSKGKKVVLINALALYIAFAKLFFYIFIDFNGRQSLTFLMC